MAWSVRMATRHGWKSGKFKVEFFVERVMFFGVITVWIG